MIEPTVSGIDFDDVPFSRAPSHVLRAVVAGGFDTILETEFPHSPEISRSIAAAMLAERGI